MRTSHKRTHTQPPAWLNSNWLRLLVTVLFLSGLAFVLVVRSGLWTAQANEVEAALTRLEKVKAEYRTNPTEENRAAVQAAMDVYKATLKTVPAAPVQNSITPQFNSASAFAVSGKVSEMSAPPSPSASAGKIGIKKGSELNELPLHNANKTKPSATDPVLQSALPPGQALVSAPIVSFEGLTANDDQLTLGGRFAPPDTTSDVSNTQIVEAVNSVFRIFSKTGTPLTATINFNTFFASVGGGSAAFSDPIILFDPLADRWLVMMWDTNNSDYYYGISTTNDATGSYYLYRFPTFTTRLPDYPHIGVWPDGYYVTSNNFNTAGTAFLGGGMMIFQRDKMILGDPTAIVILFEVATSGGLSPADIDGVAAPPVGTPGFFMEFRADEYGDPADALRIFEGRPNYTTPLSSTLTQLADLPTASFDPRTVSDFVSTRAEVEQAGAGEGLDSLSGRLMHRTAYRTLAGGVQSFALNFTVNASGVTPNSAITYQAGPRWMELRRSAGGVFSIANQATFAPEAGNPNGGRDTWMASAAQDGEGNFGLAYSVSKKAATSIVTTIGYTGRLPGDAANTFGQGEQLLPLANQVQTGTSSRWGDYSSLSVDPADECTFWGANEYVANPAAGGFTSFNWSTRIFSFKVNPSCVTVGKGTISGTATALIGGTPIQNANITGSGGFLRQTAANGTYSMSVAPGTYNMTCTKAGFNTVAGTVTVAAGGTATFNCQLIGTPTIVSAPAQVVSESCNVDGRFDPNETVTVNLCVTNTGGAPTTNLVGTLAASGGVTAPSGAQTYGAVGIGATVCKPFTFKVDPSLLCGNNVVLTLNLQDGATTYGPFTFTFGSGSAVLALVQGFDGVTAPSLPSGWVATNVVGGSPLWVTSVTTPNSGPNAAFVDDPAAVSDKVLETPAVNFSSTAAALSFRNNYNLESTFDGGVLEISVNGGAYVDVATLAGASFTSGGYNGTIDTGFSNPLAGRSAWTGNAGGYVLSRVALGSSLVGKSAKFRFRMGSDTSVAGTGWRVDDVQVENGFACCVSVTPVVSLTDPAACTGPGNNVAGSVALTNPTGTALTGGTVTVALPAGLVGTDGCTSNFGACVVSPTAITWTGTVPGNSTLNISYLAQVGDVQAGTQLCVLTSGSFTGSGVVPVQTCLTVNCQAPGPGGIIPSVPPGGFGASPPSDQKPGSILIYPVYTSGSDSSKQNTRISLTNVSPGQSAFVHLYFVDGSTCSVADAFICLTPNQTTTFLASDLDPGTTGYLVAMAVNRDGCPINFNYLVGDEYAKFSSGHAGGLGAVSVPAVPGSFTVCGAQASVQFDGVNYAPLPRTVALDNVASRADGNSTLLVLNRVGGDLLTTASVLTNLFGNLYNDAEVGLSFSLRPNTCQYRALVDNNFPRSTPRFEQFIPAGRSGWFKISSTDDIAIVGAAFTLNTNSSASANAFNGGHNLHTLTTTTSARYIVPVLPVSCQ